MQLELRQVAAPFLMDVHTAIRDTVHLAVRDGLSALYVERISGRESVPVVSQVGSRLPLHATGVGKVLLAAAPPEVVEQALRSLTRMTRHTVVEPGRLRRELAEVRRRRYARTSEEMSPGAASLAVPVQVERPRGPVVVAALGIVVPPHRRDLPRLVPVLEVAARGHRPRTRPHPRFPLTGRIAVPSADGAAVTLGAVRTQVGIIGAGPAGLLLSRLLTLQGIDNVVLENRSRDYVEARIRAGILEQHTVDTLIEAGVGDRLQREGLEHRGIYLQYPGTRHKLDFPELCGRTVWVYGQTEVTKDLIKAQLDGGPPLLFEVSDVTPEDVDTDSPRIRFTDADGNPQVLECDVVAGTDGFHGPSRAVVQQGAGREGVGAHLPLRLAGHPGRRRAGDRRADLRLAPRRLRAVLDALAEGLAAVPAGRPRREDRGLVRRPHLGQPRHAVRPRGLGAQHRHRSPTSRCCRCARSSAPRCAAAGCSSPATPRTSCRPTGAKGLNLAVADVTLLASALVRLLQEKQTDLVDSYSDRALARVWRCTHFSWFMTSMLHRSGDDFDAELQLSQLRRVVASEPAARELAENYTGLPLDL